MRAFCALAALLIAALATPAIASASAPATQEYDLDLPKAEGDDNGGGGSQEDDAAAIAPPTSSPPTAPAPETVAPVTPEAIEETGAGQPSDEKGSKPEGGAFEPAPDRPKRHLTSSGSGDGGFPALLLLLGAIAGISVGFAFWRLRRMTGGPGAPGSSAPADVTSGTQ
jgi:hypothetical protein